MELGSKPSSSPTQKLNDVIRFCYYLIVSERDIHRSVCRSVGLSVWLIIFFLFVRRSWLLLLFSLFSLYLISKMEHGRENETIRRNRKRKMKKLSFWEFKNETFFSAEGHRPEQCTEIMKSNFTVPLPTEVGSWLNHFFFPASAASTLIGRIPVFSSSPVCRGNWVERRWKGLKKVRLFNELRFSKMTNRILMCNEREGFCFVHAYCLVASAYMNRNAWLSVNEPQCLSVRTWTAMPVCPYIQDAYLKGE